MTLIVGTQEDGNLFVEYNLSELEISKKCWNADSDKFKLPVCQPQTYSSWFDIKVFWLN